MLEDFEKKLYPFFFSSFCTKPPVGGWPNSNTDAPYFMGNGYHRIGP